MKKKLLTCMTTVAILTACAGTAFAAPVVEVNGQSLQLDQPPLVVESRTLVPMRAIFEALGCDVKWNADTKTVVAQKELDFISFTIGDNKLYTSEESLDLDVPAQIVNGRTMVPLRSVSEALDASVSWDATTETVTIISKAQGDYKYETKHFIENNKQSSVDMAYPQLINRADASSLVFDTLNKQFEAAARAHAVALQNDIKNTMADITELSDFTCTAKERFAVTYNQGNYFSVLFQNVIDTHGAHPNTIRNAATYDMTTGTALTLTDILKGEQKEIEQLIFDGFSAQIQKNPTTFYPEAEDYLKKAIENNAYSYYLTDTGLTFYFQQYEIAPYAAGFQEYTLPFSQKDAFKINF